MILTSDRLAELRTIAEAANYRALHYGAVGDSTETVAL